LIPFGLPVEPLWPFGGAVGQRTVEINVVEGHDAIFGFGSLLRLRIQLDDDGSRVYKAEVRAAQVCPAEVRPLKINLTERRAAQICTAEIDASKVLPIQ
jgi:hypothetical protein